MQVCNYRKINSTQAIQNWGLTILTTRYLHALFGKLNQMHMQFYQQELVHRMNSSLKPKTSQEVRHFMLS